MPPRQTFFTDERLDRSEIVEIIRSLEEASGVVFRHDALPRVERIAFGREIATLCHDRGLSLSVAGDVGLARKLGATLIHRPSSDPGKASFSLPVHNETEAREAARRGAALVYVSPVFATASHPDEPPLGVKRASELARLADCPAIALGGMNESAFSTLPDFVGWAGISAFRKG